MYTYIYIYIYIYTCVYITCIYARIYIHIYGHMYCPVVDYTYIDIFLKKFTRLGLSEKARRNRKLKQNKKKANVNIVNNRHSPVINPGR